MIEASSPVDTSTKEALIRAARSQFARRGYDGASIRAITGQANANLGAVTYHFGSKEALYETVLARVLAPLGQKVRERAARGGSAVERTREVVRLFFEYLGENPDLPQLMLQEIAAGKPPPAPVAEVLGTAIGTLGAVVAEGQERGEVRDGDPRLLGLSCVIQAIHLTLIRHWLAHLRGTDASDPEEQRRLVEHALAFAGAGLEARAGSA